MLTEKLKQEVLDNLDSDKWEVWFDRLSPQEQKDVGDFAFSIITPAQSKPKRS